MPRYSFLKPLLSEQFIIREVLSMSNSKSTGFDDIYVKLLKISIHVMGDILTHIMNCSITSGMFIDDWKGAQVTPLYKVGE